MRWAAASISRVGPPPPSPHPKGTMEEDAMPFSAKFDSAWCSSRTASREL